MLSLALTLALDCPGLCLAGVGGDVDPAQKGSFTVAAGGAIAAVSAAVNADGACGPSIGTVCGEALAGCTFLTRVDAFCSQETFVAVSYGSAYPGPRWTILPAGATTLTQPMAVPCGKDSFLWAVVFDASSFQILAEEQLLLHCSPCEQD